MGFASLLPFLGKAVGFIKGNKELIGGAANAVLGQRNAGQDRAMEQARLDEQKRQFDARQGEDVRQFDATQKAGYGRTALEATQLDPLKQQRSRQQMALVEQLLKGFAMPKFDAASGTATGGFQFDPSSFAAMSSFYGPQAMGAAESQFANTAKTATDGQYAMPDLEALGYPSLRKALTPQPPQVVPPPGRASRTPGRFATMRTPGTEY